MRKGVFPFGRLRLALAALLATAPVIDAGAGPRIGQVKTAAGEVSITRAGQTAPAAIGAPLEEGDMVATGADGTIGMTFTDNSRLSLGPGSMLTLERYRFTEGGRSNAFDSRLTAGSLTAASGGVAASRPDAMRVLMPTTVLGVRGTEFAVRVAE